MNPTESQVPLQFFGQQAPQQGGGYNFGQHAQKALGMLQAGLQGMNQGGQSPQMVNPQNPNPLSKLGNSTDPRQQLIMKLLEKMGLNPRGMTGNHESVGTMNQGIGM